LSHDDRPALGLRERKKARTRAAIQQHALRLFREQGYDATTVEQIAAAAEVSPSTFFRYFPTKEDVVLYDAFDPLIFAAFEAQPAALGPLQALRGALHTVLGTLSAEEVAEQRERALLMVAVPELRMRMLDQIVVSTQQLAELVARRVGRRADELAVRTFVGAVVGAMMAPLLAAAEDPQADYLALMDASLAHLEAGLPL
jgi:AcrR family transcriptional regulator